MQEKGEKIITTTNDLEQTTKINKINTQEEQTYSWRTARLIIDDNTHM